MEYSKRLSWLPTGSPGFKERGKPESRFDSAIRQTMREEGVYGTILGRFLAYYTKKKRVCLCSGLS